MAPRKQPRSLLDFSILATLDYINDVCYEIYEKDGEYDYCKNGQKLSAFKEFIYSHIPARLFNLLCKERKCVAGDMCIQISVLAHPRLTYFAADPDLRIPHHFWIDLIPSLENLVELSFKMICTDEILAVIGKHCHLLEELNAISRVVLKRSPFNATVLTRNVSDEGLKHLITLKRLRVLCIDPPRNEKLRWKLGKCISQSGIRQLVSCLPSLEELRVESCDIGTTLTSGDSLQSLTLKKINCHFPSPDSVHKLLQICPGLRDLKLTHLGNQSDEVLQEVTNSDVRLHHLDLSFFKYSPAMSELLSVKGSYIVSFSLIEIDTCITCESVIIIGQCCPNIRKLRLISPATNLHESSFSQVSKETKMFTQLKTLSLGFNNVDFKTLLLFFMRKSSGLAKLDIKHQTVINFDRFFIKVVNEGLLNCVNSISLDTTLVLSVDTVKYIIDKCQYLKFFMVNCLESDKLLKYHIWKNNYDIIFVTNYCD